MQQNHWKPGETFKPKKNLKLKLIKVKLIQVLVADSLKMVRRLDKANMSKNEKFVTNMGLQSDFGGDF